MATATLLRDKQVTARTQKFTDSLEKWCARERGRKSELARAIADGQNLKAAREAVSRWFKGTQAPTGDQILAIQAFFAARPAQGLKCPHCGEALDPKWVKKMAGQVVGRMGKTAKTDEYG
jgi:hypothetical protein